MTQARAEHCNRIMELAQQSERPNGSIKRKLQKRKRNGTKKASMKRLKAEMEEIGEQQKRIRKGQMEIRGKFEEIEFECDQLKKETLLISQQAAWNQHRLNLMFKIVKARDDNNFPEAAELTQSLREYMMKQNMNDL